MPGHHPFFSRFTVMSPPRVLRARLHDIDGVARFISIHTLTSAESLSYPILEPHLACLNIQPVVHSVLVRVMHRDSSGQLEISYFRCFFRRHRRLPRNDTLDVQGEVIVMRILDVDFTQLEDLRPTDTEIADHVVHLLAPYLHDFQEHRTPFRAASLNTRLL
ncbi:hypothetical protein R3P38DRAFT_3175554 [Favolaschia claudopus]|uniref:Uncharacterized protein n=1 Tax=Favolaschia claudopus TaxID=2862362 RepID=A0AAW0D3X6_9AGAR